MSEKKSEKKTVECFRCSHELYKKKNEQWQHLNQFKHENHGMLCNVSTDLDGTCCCNVPSPKGEKKADTESTGSFGFRCARCGGTQNEGTVYYRKRNNTEWFCTNCWVAKSNQEEILSSETIGYTRTS